MMENVLQIAAVVFAVALVVHFLRPPCNLRIVIHDRQVEVSGRALTGRRGHVVDFIQYNLPEARHGWVEGYWDGRRLRLRFSGGLSGAQQQRIRNFLVTIL
jgi:hypothetical protein